MNKQTVGHSESYESYDPATGLKRWTKNWYQKEINEDADPTEAFKEAKALVNSWGSNAMPEQEWSKGVYNQATGVFTLPEQKPPPIRNLAAERLEILIDDAKDFTELDTLYDECNMLGMIPQYRAKRDSFQSNK
jgi:hypothetical protein